MDKQSLEGIMRTVERRWEEICAEKNNGVVISDYREGRLDGAIVSLEFVMDLLSESMN